MDIKKSGQRSITLVPPPVEETRDVIGNNVLTKRKKAAVASPASEKLQFEYRLELKTVPSVIQ